MSRTHATIAAIGLLGCGAVGLFPLGCAGRAVARQDPTDLRPPVPERTVERLTACVQEYGAELPDGHASFSPFVRVDDEGKKLEVITDDIPAEAHDFAACTRVALQDMAVPEWMLSVRPGVQAGATMAQRSALASPVVVVLGVSIVLADLAIEAAGITIVFTIGLDVLNEAGKDVWDAGRRRRTKKDECAAHYAACMNTPVAYEDGNHWNHTRCAQCLNKCRNDEEWPSHVSVWVGTGSCAYWTRGWGL